MRILVLYLAILYFTTCYANESIPADIVGSLLVECGQPVLHTVRDHSDAGILIPDEYVQQTQVVEDKFVPDSNVSCLRDQTEILNYCRKLYSWNITNQYAIEHTIVAPFAIPLNHWPGATENILNVSGSRTIWSRPYWCIATNQSIKLDSNELNPSSVGQHLKLTSLLDLHKALFAKKFGQLRERTNKTVQLYLKTMLKEAKGLRELNRTYPKLAHYLGSNMLQRAHDQLNNVWLKEESQWSHLESSEHFDLIQQLTQEEIEGENEFSYTLQEPQPDNDRVQSALSRLLSGLTDLVNEQLRHLKVVSQNQPWSLTLDRNGHYTGLTTNLHHHIINIYQVHASLLNYVGRATLAINKFHSFIANHFNHSSSSNAIEYKSILVTNYHTLQNSLSIAKQILEQTKYELLNYLNQHKTYFLSSTTTTTTNNNNNGSSNQTNTVNSDYIHLMNISSSDKLLPNLVQEKHHSDLLKFDAVLLGLYGSNQLSHHHQQQQQHIWMNRNQIDKTDVYRNQISDLWLPYDHPRRVAATQSTNSKKTVTETDLALCSLITFLIILKALVITLSLLGVVVVICRLSYLIQADRCVSQQSTTGYIINRFKQLFWINTHQLKHWLQNLTRSSNQSRQKQFYTDMKIVQPNESDSSTISRSPFTFTDDGNSNCVSTSASQGYINPLDSVHTV